MFKRKLSLKKSEVYPTCLLLLVSVIIYSSCNAQQENKEELGKKPNIIFVITDDQGYGDLGFTGNTVIKTPAIDKFAGEAVSLTNYHVGTTCAPTRAGLMTGRNCNRNGVWHTIMGASILNKDEVTVADVLQQNGYKTGMFGKWHLGDNHPYHPYERGFDEAFYHGGGGVEQTPDYWNNGYFNDTYFRNGKPEKTKGYCTDVWFKEAIKFIEAKKDEPFFCYLSLNAPHSPFNVPEEYYNLYKDETTITEDQKRFYGMITNIDDNFSKLLKTLETLGIDKNTIIIFTTDNGTAAGYKLNIETGKVNGYNAGMQGIKGSQYDGGHRVPFIIRWPNMNIGGGKELSELVAHVDMLPTLASLSGINLKPTKTLDGTDVSQYLLGKGKMPIRMVVTDTQRVPWPIKGKQNSVMDGNWRLIDGKKLYNVENDPGQKVNLATQHPDRVNKMNAFYETWWSDVIKETKYSAIDLGTVKMDVLTCHDAHTTNNIPHWNQRLIRLGRPMKPAPFLVNFVAAGIYKFHLTRWPMESGLALGAEALDTIPAMPFSNGRIAGKAMTFAQAHLKIAGQEKTVEVDNKLKSTTIEMVVPKGETELTAYFDLVDGTPCNAFYVYVERVK